jgi:uncharacterized protein DUF3551
MRTIALATAALATLSLTGVDARADGSWCAYDVRGGTNCGFYSFAQCRANLSGIGGNCVPNPSFQTYGGDSGRRARNWRY